MNRIFSGIAGLALVCFWVGGCVDKREIPSEREFADARSRLEQGIGIGEPKESAWSSKLLHREVHVEATTECSGWFWKKQLTYARAFITAEGEEGAVAPEGMTLSVWIHQATGLFAGVDAESVVPTEKYAEAVLIVEGNRWSDPCGCVLATGTVEVLYGSTMMASRVICPEGGDYRLDEES